MSMRCILKVGHPEPCVYRESSETAMLTPDMCRKEKFGWQCSKCSVPLRGPFCHECEGEHGVELPTEFVDVTVKVASALAEGGVKFDAGKTLFSLLPWDAVRDVADVFTHGALKYEERNWEKGMLWSRVFDSTQRHLTDWFQKRETFDPDGTGLRNIAQAAWGCLVLLAWELRDEGSKLVKHPKTGEMVPADDRPGERKE